MYVRALCVCVCVYVCACLHASLTEPGLLYAVVKLCDGSRHGCYRKERRYQNEGDVNTSNIILR